MKTVPRARRLAALGGAYGNLAGLEACLADAAGQGGRARFSSAPGMRSSRRSWMGSGGSAQVRPEQVGVVPGC